VLAACPRAADRLPACPPIACPPLRACLPAPRARRLCASALARPPPRAATAGGADEVGVAGGCLGAAPREVPPPRPAAL